MTHDHATPEEASACEECDEFVCGVTNSISRRQMAELRLEADGAAFFSQFRQL